MSLVPRRPWLPLAIIIFLLAGWAILTQSPSREHRVARKSWPSAAQSSEVEAPPASAALSDSGIFHVVLAFRSHGKELCRAITSAMALGYPLPSLVQLDPSHASSIAADFDLKLEALDSFHAGRDDDLVLLMEGSNVWFQLRPQVLLSRYYDQHHASAHSHAVLLAGEYSDDQGEGHVKLANMDAMLGTVQALRSFLERARGVVASHKEYNSTFDVYAHLVDQLQNEARSSRSSHSIASSEAISKSLDVRFDLALISSTDARMPKGSDANKYLRELSTIRPPFWTMVEDDLPNGATWQQRPLRVNSKGGVIPAVVIYEDGGDQTSRQWPKTWFSRSLVSLWRVQRELPMSPVAFAGGKFWWPHRHGTELYEVVVRGAQRYMDEDSVCGGLIEETLSGRS